MNPQRRAFVNAYLGEANGNGTRAAISAGYSEATAAQQASRLLKDEEIRSAIAARLDRADISTDRILQRLGLIANTVIEKAEARDVISAAKVILQVNGALQPKQQSSGITVNIGFLNSAEPPTVTVEEVTTDAKELTPRAQVGLPVGILGSSAGDE